MQTKQFVVPNQIRHREPSAATAQRKLSLCRPVIIASCIVSFILFVVTYHVTSTNAAAERSQRHNSPSSAAEQMKGFEEIIGTLQNRHANDDPAILSFPRNEWKQSDFVIRDNSSDEEEEDAVAANNETDSCNKHLRVRKSTNADEEENNERGHGKRGESNINVDGHGMPRLKILDTCQPYTPRHPAGRGVVPFSVCRQNGVDLVATRIGPFFPHSDDEQQQQQHEVELFTALTASSRVFADSIIPSEAAAASASASAAAAASRASKKLRKRATTTTSVQQQQQQRSAQPVPMTTAGQGIAHVSDPRLADEDPRTRFASSSSNSSSSGQSLHAHSELDLSDYEVMDAQHSVGSSGNTPSSSSVSTTARQQRRRRRHAERLLPVPEQVRRCRHRNFRSLLSARAAMEVRRGVMDRNRIPDGVACTARALENVRKDMARFRTAAERRKFVEAEALKLPKAVPSSSASLSSSSFDAKKSHSKRIDNNNNTNTNSNKDVVQKNILVTFNLNFGPSDKSIGERRPILCSFLEHAKPLRDEMHWIVSETHSNLWERVIKNMRNAIYKRRVAELLLDQREEAASLKFEEETRKLVSTTVVNNMTEEETIGDASSLEKRQQQQQQRQQQQRQQQQRQILLQRKQKVPSSSSSSSSLPLPAIDELVANIIVIDINLWPLASIGDYRADTNPRACPRGEGNAGCWRHPKDSGGATWRVFLFDYYLNAKLRDDGSVRYVMHLDSRDSFFQANPFDPLEAGSGGVLDLRRESRKYFDAMERARAKHFYSGAQQKQKQSSQHDDNHRNSVAPHEPFPPSSQQFVLVTGEIYQMLENDSGPNKPWMSVFMGRRGVNKLLLTEEGRKSVNNNNNTKKKNNNNRTDVMINVTNDNKEEADDEEEEDDNNELERMLRILSPRTLPSGKPLPALCSGLYLGTLAAMREYVSLFKHVLSCGKRMYGEDQGAASVAALLGVSATFQPYSMFASDPLVGPYTHYIETRFVDVWPQVVGKSSSLAGAGAPAARRRRRQRRMYASSDDDGRVPKSKAADIAPFPSPTLSPLVNCDGRRWAISHQLDRHWSLFSQLVQHATEVEAYGAPDGKIVTWQKS